MRLTFLSGSRLLSIIATVLVFLSGCATVVSPTGGPKDITPPKVLKTDPSDLNTNFKETGFSITFNEYVDIKEPSKQVVISPPMAKAPDYKIKGKTLTVTFNEKLKENTTYNFNFGSSIADINENNVLDNFQYVFSTGNTIDSLEVKGEVKWAKNNTMEKGVYVILHRNPSDSAIVKTLPDYFTRTNTDGSFKIKNLGPGKYRIFALKDVNENYRFDLPDEAVAFSEETINIIDTIKPVSLQLFQESKKKQRIEKVFSPEYGKIEMYFNRPTGKLSIRTFDNTLFTVWHRMEINATRDTAVLWYKDLTGDSLKLLISDNDVVIDTAAIALIQKSKDDKPKRFSKNRLDINSNLRNNEAFEINANIDLVASHPIRTYDLKKMEIKDDSSTITDYLILEKDSALRRFSIVYPWKEDKTYHITIPKGVFKDVYGYESDTLKYTFKTRPTSAYGDLLIKTRFKKNNGSYIFQLLDEKENVMREQVIEKDENIENHFLLPGKYAARLITDVNKNGKWDTGDYEKKIQPEKIIYYKEPINVRANWDLDLDWDVK